MKIRVYCWEVYNTFNVFYRFTHPDKPGYEHRYGVTKIEYEADNGQVQIFIPLIKDYFDATSVNAALFKCKNCNTIHVMLREDNAPMHIHFANPCHCGNINTDSYRPDGCLVCYCQLPVFERITDYKHNSKYETKVEKIMDEDVYNNLIKTILQKVTG